MSKKLGRPTGQVVIAFDVDKNRKWNRTTIGAFLEKDLGVQGGQLVAWVGAAAQLLAQVGPQCIDALTQAGFRQEAVDATRPRLKMLVEETDRLLSVRERAYCAPFSTSMPCRRSTSCSWS